MADQRDLAEQLLAVARDDEAAARTLYEAESLDSVVGFHCQQAVEKAQGRRGRARDRVSVLA